MATYVIGDIHGCLDELKHLLTLIKYDSTHDRLGFVGDLVNRGPDSLATIRYIKQLNNAVIVLGNHDITLLAQHYGVIQESLCQSQLNPIIAAADCSELMTWLAAQPLAYYWQDYDFLMVHAGIPPGWSIKHVVHYAHEVQQILKGDRASELLAYAYHHYCDTWHSHLTKYDRLTYIINALVRIRFCDSKGLLDFKNSTAYTTSENFKPWFEWYTGKTSIVFGHWAALNGKGTHSQCYPIDTGCVWGKQLTALRLDDCTRFCVEKI